MGALGPDGSLLYVSDEDGVFQVIRRSPDGRDKIALTEGKREHGEPSGTYGYAPLPSPDGRRVVHSSTLITSFHSERCSAHRRNRTVRSHTIS